jgi:UDP-N-acetylglucosamine--N-acetylmuramyl-(pentapeptide) pyrophosphoryl-undecaprenol N-acetylglucosamine transferase
VIAAGGTAGHVVPALAVAETLREQGAEVTFIGGSRAEARLVPRAGFPLRVIDVEGVSRTNPVRALRALWRAAWAFVAVRQLLAELSPDAVMGGGGYVAGPVGLASLSRRIPLVITEADSHLGLANRLLARGASKVCLAFPISGLQSPRYKVTGRPVIGAGADRAIALTSFGIARHRQCLLVFGGSLGARSINLAAVDAFGGGEEPPFHVLHVAGSRDYRELLARGLPARYTLIEYLEAERFAQALAAADLVVARAGGSVFEIAAHGLPAILVPYPHASADHQSTNARWMAQAGAALVIDDRQLSGPRLATEVMALMGDGDRLAEMARASAALARPDAAAQVAEELLHAAGARRRPDVAARRGEEG